MAGVAKGQDYIPTFHGGLGRMVTLLLKDKPKLDVRTIHPSLVGWPRLQDPEGIDCLIHGPVAVNVTCQAVTTYEHNGNQYKLHHGLSSLDSLVFNRLTCRSPYEMRVYFFWHSAEGRLHEDVSASRVMGISNGRNRPQNH